MKRENAHNKKVKISVAIGAAALLLGVFILYPQRKIPVELHPVGATPRAAAIAQLKARLIGTWQGTDDPRSQVSYNENGMYADVYIFGEGGDPVKGEVTDRGTWEVSDTPPSPTEGVAAGQIYFLKKVPEGTGKAIDYSIIRIDDKALQLSYLARGNALSFKRVRN